MKNLSIVNFELFNRIKQMEDIFPTTQFRAKTMNNFVLWLFTAPVNSKNPKISPSKFCKFFKPDQICDPD